MKKKGVKQFYDDDFYKKQVEDSIRSAKVVLGILFEVYKPFSVIDFGCGYGSWLMVAESLGSKVLKGFDGDWILKEKLLSKKIDFSPVNFEDFEVHGIDKYDLSISLEVAEHLSEEIAESLINTLCKASDIVLFSASIKHQGGTNHINEQWQSYWINLFQANGFEPFDIFRGAIWDNNKVKWWYRQNTFLYVNTITNNPKLNFEMLKAMEKPIPDVVHPQYYERRITNYIKQIQEPTLKFCLDNFKRYVFRKLHISGS